MFSKSSSAESRNRRRRTSISLCFPFCGARIEASIDLFRRPRSAALDRTIDGVAQGLQLLLAFLDQAQALAHDLAGGAVAPLFTSSSTSACQRSPTDTFMGSSVSGTD